MPSFDVVSEVDSHELTNAVDQASRELTTRFDFKGVDAKFTLEESVVSQSAPSDFQLKQMTDILKQRLTARGIDIRCLEFGDVETNLAGARQKITVKQGIEQKLAKKIVATVSAYESDFGTLKVIANRFQRARDALGQHLGNVRHNLLG